MSVWRAQQASAPFHQGRPRWHALTVAPQREGQCERLLAAMDVEAFHPVQRRTAMVRGKRVELQTRYLPGYVFARFPGAVVWHVLRERCLMITGAVRMSSGELAILEPSDLRGLQRMACVDQAMEDRRQAALRIKAGDTVRLLSGPFEGQTVEVWDVGSGHAKFHIRMFGGEIFATAPVTHMERQQPVAPPNNIV